MQLTFAIIGVGRGARLTTPQASELTGVPVPTLVYWRMQRAPRGPKVTMVSNSPRYLIADLEAWLATKPWAFSGKPKTFAKPRGRRRHWIGKTVQPAA